MKSDVFCPLSSGHCPLAISLPDSNTMSVQKNIFATASGPCGPARRPCSVSNGKLNASQQQPGRNRKIENRVSGKHTARLGGGRRTEDGLAGKSINSGLKFFELSCSSCRLFIVLQASARRWRVSAGGIPRDGPPAQSQS